MALTGDGKRVAFLAGGEGGRDPIITLGDQVIETAGWVVRWPLAMTDDAGVVACQLTQATSEKACIAKNGQRGETFDAVGTPVLSADGKVVAYRAQLGGCHFVVVGDRKQPTFDFVKDPALSPDGKHFAYAAARGNRWLLVVDTIERSLDAEPVDVFIGPDHRFVGWSYLEPSASGGSKARVVVGDRLGEPFDLVGRPSFSPDGSRFAYFAERGDRRYIVVGERTVEVTGQLSNPVFSRDGTQLGYGARIGRELWWKVLSCP